MKKILVVPFVMLFLVSQIACSNADIVVDHNIFRSFAFVTDEPDPSLFERVLDNNKDSLKGLQGLMKNERFIAEQIQVDEALNNWTEYDSIAFSFNDLLQHESLLELFHRAIDESKMVYVYGEILLEDFYRITDKKIYVSILSNEAEEKTFYITDLNNQNNNRSAKQESIMQFGDELNIIGMTVNPKALQKLVLTNIKAYDKGMNTMSPLQETYLITLLEHELDEINKQARKMPTSVSLHEQESLTHFANQVQMASSDSIISAVANYLGTHNYGKHEIQWGLYRNANSLDSSWDYLYFGQFNLITNAAGTSKKQNVIHKLLYSSTDQIQTSQPGNTNSGPYAVNLDSSSGLNFVYSVDANPKISMNMDWGTNITEWAATKSNLHSAEHYEFYTAFKKHLTLSPSAGIHLETITEFHKGWINKVKIQAVSDLYVDIVY